jgi:hypothetical protein
MYANATSCTSKQKSTVTSWDRINPTSSVWELAGKSGGGAAKHTTVKRKAIRKNTFFIGKNLIVNN